MYRVYYETSESSAGLLLEASGRDEAERYAEQFFQHLAKEGRPGRPTRLRTRGTTVYQFQDLDTGVSHVVSVTSRWAGKV